MSQMSFPVVHLQDGTSFHCNSTPSVVPCGGNPGIGCFGPEDNCFGFFYDFAAHAGTILPSVNCTTSICPLGTYDQAHFDYIPSLAGNAFYAAFFAILIAPQLYLGLRYKTWMFLVGMMGGLLLEVIGYIGRILIHNNPFAKNPFLIYLICLTIGPAFFSASIYFCLGRIVNVYPPELSRFKPRTYSYMFISCDLLSLILQAVGGALSSTATTPTKLNTGVNTMLAGLSFQVASLSLFFLLCAEFGYRVYVTKAGLPVRNRMQFQLFLYALTTAALLVFTRCVFRVAELSKGFHGPLDNQQVTFMILEGAVIGMAILLLTALHPGPVFANTGAASFSQVTVHMDKLGHEDLVPALRGRV